jgi:putative RNA 2'-phosphotransferase
MSDVSAESRHRILQLQKLGRFLSLLLKHRSVRFPIQLDAEGYASFKDIMRILKGLPNFRWATMADVKAVLDLPGPQRFEIKEGQGKPSFIRVYMRQPSAEEQAEPAAPPSILYYGTPPGKLEDIMQNGLTTPDRQHVRLAADLATARSMAVRLTPDPVILHIDTSAAQKAGIRFFNSAPGIYSCEAIPPQFIQEFK